MSTNVQEQQGKTYAYEAQTSTTPLPAGSGLEQQKQKLMTDIEDFLDSLVAKMERPTAGGTVIAPTTGTSSTEVPSTVAPTTGGTTAGATITGAPTTGVSTTGGSTPGRPSTGSTTPGAPATGSGEQPGTESQVNREALEVFQNREAYRRDVEKDVAKRRESATVASGILPLTREALALKHQSDSNRAPLTDSREFAPAFGSLGRGQAATAERMSAPTPKVRTTPESGVVAAKPIDAYWASYGTAVERLNARTRADRQTKAMYEVILGSDDRIKVNNTTAYPWRCICSLLITAQNGKQFIGTGWLVAPRLVLTAGHCVYLTDEGGWAAQVEVTPGRNGSQRPYNSCISRDLRSVTGYTQDGDSNCDYGAILLPADKRLGDQLGWFGYAARDDDYLKQCTVNLSGYPGDGGKTGEDGTQWFMSRGVKEVMDRQFEYEIDTYGGQSGSPVWELASNGSRYGVGIHTHGASVSNGATRIVREVFDNIVRWAGEAP